MPWWICALIAVAIVAVLGYRQIDVSVKVLSVLVAAKFLVVLILGAVIVVKGGSFGTSGLSLEPLTPHALVSRSLPIALLFWFASFVGFEATAIYSEEAKDPKRTVLRATFLAVIVIGDMRPRRICHCDASFRPQLGRARISPSGRGGPSALLNRLRAATTSRWRAQFATRLTPTVFRFSTGATDLFLNRSLAGPALARNALSTNTTHCSPRLACVAMPC